MPQSVRTTKGRCTALATLTHRSPCSRFDRRLPSIEFNTPHQAPVERHRKAIGEQKSKPLTSVSVLVSHACPQALNMHLAVPQHRAQHRNLNSTRGRFRPRRYESLASRIGCPSVRQSLEKTLQNVIRETTRSCPGRTPGTFWRALFSTGLTGLSCRKASQKAAAQHSRSAAFSVSPRQYGPNHAKPCSTHHEAGHQDGHFLALTHVESALKRLKRTCHQRERRQQNGQQQAQE